MTILILEKNIISNSMPTSRPRFRKPDLAVDPENTKVREPAAEANATESHVDNRFSETSSGVAKRATCGWQAFMQRIVGGEICEIDEFPWAAMLLYESSENSSRLSRIFNSMRTFQSRQM